MIFLDINLVPTLNWYLYVTQLDHLASCCWTRCGLVLDRVHPKNYRHGEHFTIFCCGEIPIDFTCIHQRRYFVMVCVILPVSLRITSTVPVKSLWKICVNRWYNQSKINYNTVIWIFHSTSFYTDILYMYSQRLIILGFNTNKLNVQTWLLIGWQQAASQS